MEIMCYSLSSFFVSVQQEVIWRRISQLAEEKAFFQESVAGVNNGGLFVELEGVRAFCPGSHIPQARSAASDDMHNGSLLHCKP